MGTLTQTPQDNQRASATGTLQDPDRWQTAAAQFRNSAGAGPAVGRPGGYAPDMMMQQKETIRFQPWATLETAAGGPNPLEIIQPASQWLPGAQVPTYQMQVNISYLVGATLYLESSPTAEGPWSTVLSYTAQTNTMLMLASEGGGFAGYIRWRVAGTAPWQICFQLKATPGASVMQQMGTPKRV